MDTIFDKHISRHNTFSAKWDNEQIYPLSVADMDFTAPPAVIEAINKANNGIYGYTLLGTHYQQCIVDWLKKRYHFQADKESILFCPRIIQAISIYLRLISPENDPVGIFTPSYSPIFNTISLNHHPLVPCALIYDNQIYHIDFKKLEECFSKIKIFLLISPHNPTGMVWTREILEKIAELAEKYGVFVISDEAHADFCYPDQHIVYSSVSDYAFHHSMLCTSPAKTFNLPGLEIANIAINDVKLREQFAQCLNELGFHNPNYFSIPAIYSAYQESDDWLTALRQYIYENKQLVQDFFEKHIPELHITQSHGTYLLWINYEQLGISEAEFKEKMQQQAKLNFSWGEDFGAGGQYFFRMNVALPRQALHECLLKMKRVLS